MIEQPFIYPQRVWDEVLRHSYEVERDGRSYLVVAWTLPGGHQTLRATARHLLDPDPKKYLTTLCGRKFRVSKMVMPDSYWTTTNCQRCFKAAKP